MESYIYAYFFTLKCLVSYKYNVLIFVSQCPIGPVQLSEHFHGFILGRCGYSGKMENVEMTYVWNEMETMEFSPNGKKIQGIY